MRTRVNMRYIDERRELRVQYGRHDAMRLLHLPSLLCTTGTGIYVYLVPLSYAEEGWMKDQFCSFSGPKTIGMVVDYGYEHSGKLELLIITR